jgi:hypothetical protein
MTRFNPWSLFAEHMAWTFVLFGLPWLPFAMFDAEPGLVDRLALFAQFAAMTTLPISGPAFAIGLCYWIIAAYRSQPTSSGTGQPRTRSSAFFYEAGYCYVAGAALSGALAGYLLEFNYMGTQYFFDDRIEAAVSIFIIALVPALLMGSRRILVASLRARRARRTEP